MVFETRARTPVVRAAFFIVEKASQLRSDAMLNWKIIPWAATWKIMWILCEHRVEASKGYVLSHISSIYSRPHADAVHRRTLLSSDVTLLKQVGWYRLWGFLIYRRRPTKYSKCHACMLVCNIYNTSEAPAFEKTSQVLVSNVPRHEWPSMLFKFTKMILRNILI